ncbi:MAG: hypothetical protein A2677_02680 [Candidatus Komeilibacteria bacterium RIFCSPHIGHO2_01_FULL_52_14]|uniref:Uncharacterized protein n=1 Tax=Candidatus Komeilibacteria bacterium RIFCSPHIGHO2_01_FULL_52_14 TaxID=1798549 RepID=A0A1G2BK43_9BACT|nr:MAG: hypothetical protein A2677_02680 [Candidatus Komeilibacteria bacterium RIFCSPHIGHO2_01_FULL_52_14]
MSATARAIAGNPLSQIVVRAVDVAVGIVTLGFITRYLGLYGFGEYTTANAVLQFASILVDFGLYLTFLREISASPPEEHGRITNNIFTLRALTALLALVAAVALTAVLPYPPVVRAGVALLAASYLFGSFISTLTAPFQKHLLMARVALVNLFNRLLLFAFVVIVVALNAGLLALFIATSVSSLLSFIVLVFLLRLLPNPLRLNFAWDIAYWREIFHKTWPIAVTTILNLIYFKADTIILSLYRPQEDVGIYGASYKVLEILTTFPHMFMGLMLPLLTAAWIARDHTRVQRLLEHSFSLFAFLTLPLIGGTLVVGRSLMTLIAGSDFTESGSVLMVLMIATAAIFFGTLYTYMVIVLDKQRAVVKYFFMTALISIIGYFILIPRYSYWGAAWMTVASEIMIIVGAWLTVRRELSMKLPLRRLTRIVLASVLMMIVALFLSRSLSVIPVIGISIVVYVLSAFILRAFSFAELKQLILKTE